MVLLTLMNWEGMSGRESYGCRFCCIMFTISIWHSVIQEECSIINQEKDKEISELLGGSNA